MLHDSVYTKVINSDLKSACEPFSGASRGQLVFYGGTGVKLGRQFV